MSFSLTALFSMSYCSYIPRYYSCSIIHHLSICLYLFCSTLLLHYYVPNYFVLLILFNCIFNSYILFSILVFLGFTVFYLLTSISFTLFLISKSSSFYLILNSLIFLLMFPVPYVIPTCIPNPFFFMIFILSPC